MSEIKLTSAPKATVESKDQQESKKKSSKSESTWNWQPIATDLAITVAKGIISGFALSLGSQIYSQSFNRKMHSSSLTVLDGGKASIAI